MNRTLVAAIVSPALPPLVLMPISFAFGGSAFTTLFASAIWCYVGALTLGVPLFMFLRWRCWLKCWQLVVGSAMAGAVAPLLVLSTFIAFAVAGGAPLFELASLLSATLLCGGVGAAVGISFWVIARPGTYAL